MVERLSELNADLVEDETTFAAMFTVTSVGMAQADPVTRRLLRVNPALCAITDYSQTELLSMSVDDLDHPDDREQDRADFAALVRGALPDFQAEKRFIRKDGSVVWVEVTGNLNRDAEGRPLKTVLVIQDVTARRESAESLERARARLAALAEATHAIIQAGPSPDTVLAAVAHQAAALLGDLAVVRLLSADGRWLEPAAVEHPDPHARAAAMAALARERHPADQGVTGAALRTGQPRRLNGEALTAERQGDASHLWPPLPAAPTAALLAVPLRAEGRAIGALSVSRAATDRPYDAKDEHFLQQLADRAGLAIARARLFDQIQAGEERLRLAVAANRMVAWEWDPATDHITTSDNFTEIYGLSTLSGGADLVALVWPEDLPAHQDKVARVAREGGEYQSQFRITRPNDGRIVWLEERAMALTDDAGRIVRVVGVATDITERKHAEEQLRESEAHARFLAEASAILATSLDDDEAVVRVVRLAVPLLADWCVVDLLGADGALHRLAVVHGDPGRAALAAELRRRHPIIPPEVAHTAWKVLRTGEPWFDPDVAATRFVAEARDEAHLSLLRQLGFASELVVPLVARGRALGVLTLVQGESGRRYGAEDVAFARQLARHCALAIDNARLYRGAREAEAKISRLFDTGVIGLIVTDSERIVEANDRFLQMVGYTRNELETGHLRWAELTPPEYAQLDELAIAEIAERGYCTPFEKEYLRQDGSRLPILIGAAAIEGTEPPWICAVLDLTAQKAGEQERVAFIDAATHDLKNPLTSLKGRVQLLLRRARREGTLDVADLEPGLAAIDADVSRMVALIDELMDASHLRTGQMLTLNPGPTDLVALAHDSVVDIRRRTSHAIVVEPTEPALVGRWDRSRLDRVVQNLLDNAVKYSPHGSRITVRVDREEDPEGMAWATLSVRDDGVGIPAADLPHIFERFRRGGNVGAIVGAGIGLAGTRQIVEQHGGTIAVESVEERGSTFVVRLPLDPW